MEMGMAKIIDPNQSFDALKRSINDPVFFFEEVLGAKLDQQQKDVIELFPHHRRLAIKSGHSSGKDNISARLGLWFHLTHYPSKVVITGPCYDDKTEILTDKGWRLFRDLDKTEKVASLVDDEMRFVSPVDWMDFPSSGEMIDYHSRDLDFSVTPNHRLYIHDNQKYRWVLREASECYGKVLPFNREVNWKGVEDSWTTKHYELFGFWMADGHARCGADGSGHKRYEVTLTQAFFPDYARRLLEVLGEKTVDSKRKIPNGKTWRPSWNYTVRGEKWARFFRENFYRGKEKIIPEWILNATQEKLRAFIHGFYMGDGDKTNGATKRIRIYGSRLIPDAMQIAGIKAGYVVNLHGPRIRHHGKAGKMEWSCTFLSTSEKEKAFPRSNNRNWSKIKYDGRVYCVKVPSGVIMVRRNGVYHWSGNTDRQVKNITWGELKAAYNHARYEIGGELNDSMLKSFLPDGSVDSEHFMIGFTAKDSDAFQGFHSPNLLVIVTEAAGVEARIWPGINSLMTSVGEARELCIGNATYEPDSEFFGMFTRNAALYKQFTLDSRKSSYCSKQWIEEMRQEFGEDSPVWKSRVLGVFPDDVADTLIPLAWVERAYARWADAPAGALSLGCDIARFGSDQTVFYKGDGIKFRCVHVAQGADLMDTTGRIIKFAADDGIPYGSVMVDDTGLGGGVTDRLMEQGHRIKAINFGSNASDPDKYANARSELYWCLRERFRLGEIAIDPQDKKLLRDLSVMRYKMTSKGQIKLEEKAEAKRRLGYSPDHSDGLVLASIPGPIADAVSAKGKTNWGLLEYMRAEACKTRNDVISKGREAASVRDVRDIPGAAEAVKQDRGVTDGRITNLQHARDIGL
jgi:phage terminase large subunit